MRPSSPTSPLSSSVTDGLSALLGLRSRFDSMGNVINPYALEEDNNADGDKGDDKGDDKGGDAIGVIGQGDNVDSN